MRTLAAVMILAACGGSTSAPVVAQPPSPAPPSPIAVVAPDSDPNTIELPGDANGLYWDTAERALYLADTTHSELLRWTEADGFKPIAKLGEKLSLGGIVRANNGSFVIPSFGFGKDGAVLVIDGKGTVTAVPKLDPKRRRVGIAAGPDGALYDVYFTAEGHDRKGGLAKLDLAKGETELPLPNLGKPVGVAATADGVFVADQDTSSIVVLRGKQVTTLAKDLPSTDLLAALPDGSFVTGGRTGTVSRIAKDGSVTTLAKGYEQARGVAYDPAGKRVFVVEYSKITEHHKLHIIATP